MPFRQPVFARTQRNCANERALYTRREPRPAALSIPIEAQPALIEVEQYTNAVAWLEFTLRELVQETTTSKTAIKPVHAEVQWTSIRPSVHVRHSICWCITSPHGTGYYFAAFMPASARS
jgi:hypothetical protein